MARLLGVSGEQVDGIRPLLSKERGGKRVDDRKVLRGIIPAMQKGRRWVDPPPPMAHTQPSTTVAAAGETRVCCGLIFSELSAPDSPEPPDAPEPEVLMIDATDIKAHPTASSLNKGGGDTPPDWLDQGGMISQLHGVCV